MTEPRPRILVVDDTPVNLKLLKLSLEKEFDVCTATSGVEGLEMARVHLPNLILLDVLMPGMDGFETCRVLKADPALKDIPVIFVTGQSDTESETTGLLLGAADYIAKPIKVSTVRQRIRNLLEREQLRKEVEAQRDLLAEQVQARIEAAEQLRLAASVFTHAREGITITDRHGLIIDVNSAFTRITGYSRDEVLGHNPSILNSGRQSKQFYAEMWATLAQEGHWYGEIWNRRKSGEVYAEMLTISQVTDANGDVQQYVALFSDITATKEHQNQLEHIAHYDALTNLPNRVLLSDRMGQALALAARRKQLLAVAYIDLDGFKAINDAHGHEVGDQMLLALAGRMKQMLRESDTLARLGGDEFVAVLVDLQEASDSVPTLSRLLSAASQPVQLGDLQLKVSASVGVTFYPQTDDVDADKLLRQADQAMYQAKLAGKNRYHVFDDAQDRSVRSRHESLDRIRQALANDEFVLFYQPKVNMRTGAIIGAEALIRWEHPERGLLAPAVFLPVIEYHPLAVAVGEWVIQTALKQLHTWHMSGLRIPVSVNVGARQLQDEAFVGRLSTFLAENPDIAPSDLELELLETSALEDVVHVSKVIAACQAIGVAFSLDDFGTGYSSLTYLKRLPVRELKIDQSFVRDMLDDPDDLAILEGVIGLAGAFGRHVIAEGVETTEHGHMLLQLGCECAQGYGVARPMPAADFLKWAEEWRPHPAWHNVTVLDKDLRPVLSACVEHRAWMQAMRTHLTGERACPPELHPDQCHFGSWLATPAACKLGSPTMRQRIEQQHQQLHQTAARLCQRHSEGDWAGAKAGLASLEITSDELIALLMSQLRSHSKSGVSPELEP